MEYGADQQLKELENRFKTLDSLKTDIHTMNEKYASWTLPYLYPESNTNKDTALPRSLDSTGARATNHLANRLISTLFPAYRPFLRLEIDPDELDKLRAAKVPEQELDKALARGEKKAVKLLDTYGHRPVAIEAAKLLIVTGNCLMYYSSKSKAHVYSLRNYCLVRDISGTVIEIITRDSKAFATFTTDVQEELRVQGAVDGLEYKDDTTVHVYTCIKMTSDGKFKVRQAADMVPLTINDNSYSAKTLPWVPLAWNLPSGEDYGRGAVEDYRGAFGALEVLNKAIVEGAVAAAEVKFLVNPGSVVDIKALNDSANGSFHAGREGDVVTIKCDKHLDFQKVQELIDRYERQVALGFLLNSAVTRDAERVTAEEIRYQAQELETAYGGVYSRFKEDWQEPVANLLMDRQQIKINNDLIYPVIVTGLDSLSRLSDVDNYRMFVDDIAIVNGIPEEFRPYFNVPNLMQFLGNNRGVDYSKFIRTQEEVQAQQEQEQQQEAQLQEQQIAAQGMADVGTQLASKDM